MSFTRMDQGTVEDWMVIGGQCAERQSRMPAVIKSMLRQLEEQVDGFAINLHSIPLTTRCRLSISSRWLIACFRRSCLRFRPARRTSKVEEWA